MKVVVEVTQREFHELSVADLARWKELDPEFNGTVAVGSEVPAEVLDILDHGEPTAIVSARVVTVLRENK